MFVCDHMRAIEFYIEAIARSRYNGTPPIAQECDSYDDFNDGKCNHAQCTQEIVAFTVPNHTVSDGSHHHQPPKQCALLGPRVLEYANNGIDINEMHGRKFYINTADAEPFFR